MNNLASYIIPSVLGLIAGIGHGMVSHHQNLPFSLVEQIHETVQKSNYQ